jgi:hypothetical protein
MRLRLLDLAVATVSVACICAPMLASSLAATGPNPALVESGGTVDQRVKQAGWISNPLDGTFEAGGSGTVDGTVSWSQFTTGRKGAKLVLSADKDPAMRDGSTEVPDYGSSPGAWSVNGSDRRFGFSVLGSIALNRFEDGAKWRGFDGKHGVEVARRGASFGAARTTIKLRAEFGSSLGSGARPTANINATAVPNL